MNRIFFVEGCPSTLTKDHARCGVSPRSENNYTKRKKLHHVIPINWSLVAALLICLVVSSIHPCSSFQLTKKITARPTRFSLFVVEPKERTEHASTRISEFSPGFHDTGTPFETVLSTSAEDQPDEEDDPVEEATGSPESRQDDEEAKATRLERAAMADALLSRRTDSKSREGTTSRTTSVGPRRVGSASQARAGSRSMNRLTDAVKKAASANTVQKKDEDKEEAMLSQSPSAIVSKSLIESTVKSMLQTSASMGLFGDMQPNPAVTDQLSIQNPPPGTVLLQSERSTKPWQAADRVSVRVATVADDLDIANLRLSVFSDFSPEMRRAFCAKSCQVLSSRRNRGATCIVATVPRYGSILSTRPDIILGTAECSYHEFEGTSLGRRRPLESILYVTEVAVSPSARRKGIGQKIMQSIDELASIRGTETIFLHVDVTNFGALSLYRRAGYTQVPTNNDLYHEFTRSLNLHDGATKGRNHFLLYKDLTFPTWLPDAGTRTLGFEITT